MRWTTAAAITLMFAELGYSAERVVDRWITETTLFRGIALPPAEFSEARVKAIALRILSAASTRKLIYVWFVPDTPKSFRVAFGASDIDPFRLWRDQYEAMVDYTAPVAHVTFIDGNAVLQYRDSHGTESRNVLFGSDPLRFGRGGINCEIVGVHRQGEEVRPGIELLIRTDSTVKEESAKALTEEYRVRLGVRELSLWFRTDCWFANQGFYPTFKGCGAPPSEDEFRLAASSACFSTVRGVRCSQ
jgi:hypothetical protein